MRRSRRAALDLLAPIEPGIQSVPYYVVAGLEQLRTAPPPLWPIDHLASWPAVVDQVTAFASQWDGRARAAGWDDVSLYGVHCRAPYANLAAMGAAFLVALDRGTVVALGPDAIAIVSPAGSRLRIYRRPADRDSQLAWADGRPASSPVDKSRAGLAP